MINDTQAVILGVMRDQAMTGGEINRGLGEMGEFFSTTKSQVYRELTTMEAAGLIRWGTKGARGSMPAKRTPAGRKAYETWFKAEPKVIIRDGGRARAHLAAAPGTEPPAPVAPQAPPKKAVARKATPAKKTAQAKAPAAKKAPRQRKAKATA